MAEDQRFEQQPEGERGGQGEEERPAETSGPGAEGRDQVGAHHVLHAMRQIDEVHDAEHQRQPGGDEEQDEAELKAVQGLDEEEGRVSSALHWRNGLHRSSLRSGASMRKRRCCVHHRMWIDPPSQGRSIEELRAASVRGGAFLGIGIRVIVEHLLDDLGLELAVRTLGGLHEIEVLDREAVGADLKSPRRDLKSAFLMAARTASLLSVLPPVALSALSIRRAAS